MIQIAPSLLSADFLNLNQDLQKIEKSADWLHLDIMDGCFVPNISYGVSIVKAVREATSLPLDAHLMIVKPDRYLEQFARAGVNLITVHVETCDHLHRTLMRIKELGCKAGVALNPHIDPGFLKFLIKDLDLVLAMSVNPGFGGQSFIASTVEKIKQIKQIINESASAARPVIAVDGGINLENIAEVAAAGAEHFVAGSAVFKSEDPAGAVAELRRKAMFKKYHDYI